MSAPDPSPDPIEVIRKKRRGDPLTPDEIAGFCRGFVSGQIPDYQVAAWLMATCIRGMSAAETLALTHAMVASGETLDWSHLPGPTLDKHSTGGVGDKTSLVLVPLMAAAGLPFVKMAGRGLGHTGGTIDKLEAIPGFRTELGIEEMRAQVERIGCAIVRQGSALVPADGLLYALRDVTGTVDCLPLIASSIMSKKLAAGAGVIVLDVKWGAGAFMPSLEDARELAHAMVAIGTGAGRRVRAVISRMEEPLGFAVGNALEVREAIDTLRGGGPAPLRELVLVLGTELLLLAGAEREPPLGRARLARLLDGGEALARFRALVVAQGGDACVVDDPSRLPTAQRISLLESEEAGWVERIDARGVAEAALAVGAGRRRKGEPIDPAAGILLLLGSRARVAPGTPLAEIHAAGRDEEAEARTLLHRAFRLSPQEVVSPSPLPEIV